MVVIDFRMVDAISKIALCAFPARRKMCITFRRVYKRIYEYYVLQLHIWYTFLFADIIFIYII